jgi:hypothetical protein
MVVWGVVSSEIEQAIEFFITRREAERMLADGNDGINIRSGNDRVALRGRIAMAHAESSPTITV